MFVGRRVPGFYYIINFVHTEEARCFSVRKRETLRVSEVLQDNDGFLPSLLYHKGRRFVVLFMSFYIRKTKEKIKSLAVKA